VVVLATCRLPAVALPSEVLNFFGQTQGVITLDRVDAGSVHKAAQRSAAVASASQPLPSFQAGQRREEEEEGFANKGASAAGHTTLADVESLAGKQGCETLGPSLTVEETGEQCMGLKLLDVIQVNRLESRA